jgi:uncharacterized membrane protein
MLTFLFFVIAAALIFFSIRITNSVRKESFERTNEAGVAEFNDFKEAERFRKKAYLAKVGSSALMILAVIFIIIGFFRAGAM